MNQCQIKCGTITLINDIMEEMNLDRTNYTAWEDTNTTTSIRDFYLFFPNKGMMEMVR